MQLRTKLTSFKLKRGFLIENTGESADTNNEKYYFILDASKNLYIAPPLIDNERWITHSSLLHDSWPILAGHIIIKDGKVSYIDEESGHFKPRRRIHLFMNTLENDIIAKDCFFKHSNLDDIPSNEHLKMKNIQDLFDFYKYVFIPFLSYFLIKENNMSFPTAIKHHDFILKAATDISKAKEFAKIVSENQKEFKFLPYTSNISTVDKALTEISGFKTKWDEGTMFFYFIFNLKENIVGSVGIKIKDEGHVAEGCYWLNKTETGKGFVTQALKLLEKEVFAQGYHRFEIWCNADNIPSVRVPERLNYHLDGNLRGMEYLFGDYHDAVVFSKLKTDL